MENSGSWEPWLILEPNLYAAIWVFGGSLTGIVILAMLLAFIDIQRPGAVDRYHLAGLGTLALIAILVGLWVLR